MAACEDQVNLVTETSSSFPNSETFHRREEFCLVIHKLLRTCSTVKAAALTDKFPYICPHLRMMRKAQKKDICPKVKFVFLFKIQLDFKVLKNPYTLRNSMTYATKIIL